MHVARQPASHASAAALPECDSRRRTRRARAEERERETAADESTAINNVRTARYAIGLMCLMGLFLCICCWPLAN